mmetsp:Transcript_129387/g.258318  ORF Transcript_129387/g.258318 Transcript_129387/m.258318 type:complete len:388 (-) Transcript_129387:69-1232(-)
MVASKKGGNDARRRKQAEDEQPPASSERRNRKKKDGWPWWLWLVGSLGLLACAGQLLVAIGGGGSEKGSSGSTGKGSKGVGGNKGSNTQRYLALALRLQEMTEVAATMMDHGLMDSEKAKDLDEELTSIEEEIAGREGKVERDLRAMVSVVRGTLYQKTGKLSDEQVEKLKNSFTYANPRYWDDYYNKTSAEERFDWYGDWQTSIKEMSFAPKGGPDQVTAHTIGDLLRPYLTPESQIMMLGCGNSNMSEQMYTAGFENIVNVDISEKLLASLRERLGASMPRMRWVYENASALSFEAGTFDVTIDKGTLDAIEQNKPLLQSAVTEAHRTLRPGGYFLSVTFNSPEVRVEQQLRPAADWESCHTHTFDRHALKERTTYYLHACEKTQ